IGDHDLMVGRTAHVTANLRARSIKVDGTVVGSLHATDRVDVQATATVDGDIVAPRLTLADGSTVNGKIDAAGRTAPKPG
ncbi:MAG TPA: polymer-forming cytoskeletal protein, partial [Vicinamibacterales bacterium]|nr:polymer-forming cytoskeletal protein [Vicinamibacterales bacterium]